MRDEFVKYLQENGVAIKPEVAEAFRAINRADFMEAGDPEADLAFPIPAGQTISQPYTVAFMLDKLDVREGMRVLDVGSGSGWTTAMLAHITGNKGKVIGIEIEDELVEFGSKNLKKYDFTHAKIEKAKKGIYGKPDEAPYDRILVSAAAMNDVPSNLKEQLAEGGIIVIPVDDKIERISDEGEEIWHGFAFVPLIEK